MVRATQFNVNGDAMHIRLIALLLAIAFGHAAVPAADRTTLVVPRYGAEEGAKETGSIAEKVFPDQAFGDAASQGWRKYARLWRAHHESPSEPSIRRFLGLPLSSDLSATPRRGRSAPKWLGWRLGSYVQIDTPHFTIFSRAETDPSREVAIDLERCYWVWTQMFFPLWEGSGQVSAMLSDMDDDDDEVVVDYLTARSSRISVQRKLRVVLFRDASEYAQTLGKAMPGIERSTGFYHDTKQTTFLYASEVPDRATRRHEMVHQLFREATRSSLGKKMPAEDSGFWLIEGIAGYFESLQLSESQATVGGWDASRLQFARHRVFVGGDEMSFDELTADGRLDAQKRQDIARWYAHAIAQTHHLMDRGDAHSRQWVYRKIADLYEIKCDLGAMPPPTDIDRQFKPFLSVNDDHLANNIVEHGVDELCLAGCEVSSRGIGTISTTGRLRWLDLSRLPVSMQDIVRLAPKTKAIEQLSLEQTNIDNSVSGWLSTAKRIRELDLSWTDVDDAITNTIAAQAELETLWLTGTKVTDASIETIGKLNHLETVDLQRTKVTEAGIERLKKLRPKLEINPLELRNP